MITGKGKAGGFQSKEDRVRSGVLVVVVGRVQGRAGWSQPQPTAREQLASREQREGGGHSTGLT